MRTLLLLCFVSSAAQAGIILEGNTDALEMVTSTAASTDYSVSWSNVTATALTTPGTTKGNVTSAGATTTILAAPSASNWRHIRAINIYNAGTIANVITLQIDVSATNRLLAKVTLAAGERLQVNGDGVVVVFDATGAQKITSTASSGYNGKTFHWSKVATAIDTIGYHYLLNKDNGSPGAWSVGTPGVNGVATACDVVGTAGTGGALSTGSHILPDPASGGWYLTRFGTNAAVANTYQLLDIVWYNTGLAVTTGAQAITTPAFPARDLNGSATGEGYQIALYALTTLGNAAAIATTTVTYVASSGATARTATFSGSVGFQAPATSLIGTWIPFTLQAGDTGVTSISSINTGTTYTSGTLMLVVYRPIQVEGVSVANFPSGSLVSRLPLNPGVRIWNKTCFGIAVLGGIATTAPSITGGVIELMER